MSKNAVALKIFFLRSEGLKSIELTSVVWLEVKAAWLAPNAL